MERPNSLLNYQHYPIDMPSIISNITAGTGCTENEIITIFEFIKQHHWEHSSDLFTSSDECFSSSGDNRYIKKEMTNGKTHNSIQTLATILSNTSNFHHNSLFGYRTLELWQKSEILQRYAVYRILLNLIHSTEDSNKVKLVENDEFFVQHHDSCHVDQNCNVREGCTMSSDTVKTSFFTSKTSWGSAYSRKKRWETESFKSSTSSRVKFCTFCRANNETLDVYSSHVLYNTETNILQCPILRKLVCPLCGSTGDKAHTLSYCPLKKSDSGLKPESVFYHIKKSHRLSSGKLRT